MNLQREILSKILGRQSVEKISFAQELGLSLEQLKEQLELLQDDDLLEFKPFTMTKWKVRITSRGQKFLNKTTED